MSTKPLTPTAADDLIVDSLRRRVRALFSLYEDAVATMTIEHVNHFERDGVVPIAFSLFHITNMIDGVFTIMTGKATLWNQTWAARVARVVAPRPFDPTIRNTFSARVAGAQGITLLDAIECWVYQHGLRHMGEIEHARGLVGLQGMTS